MYKSCFIVLVATGGPAPLLANTLDSISKSRRAAEIKHVIIAENGERGPARKCVETFSDRLPIELRYTEKPNKSHALNQALVEFRDANVLFFDDDVRLHPDCLSAYIDGIKSRELPTFYGGQCKVDYEQAPPAWMTDYLPPSAVGWSLGDKALPFFRPEALGFNFAASARDILSVGGFNETHGPGTKHPLGDETDMQKRLLAAGIGGVYLPDALVWHNVPKSRCSQTWALRRARQTGYLKGTWLLQEKPNSRHEFLDHYRKRLRQQSLYKVVIPEPLLPQRAFKARYYVELYRGYLDALEESVAAA